MSTGAERVEQQPVGRRRHESLDEQAGPAGTPHVGAEVP
jgi:hypothetical protein